MIPFGAALDFIRGNWRTLLPIAAIGVLIVWLLLAKADARHWQLVAANKDTQIEATKRAGAEQSAAAEKDRAAAIERMAERIGTIERITQSSKETVREYAQTDAGRAQCLDAGRVRGIDKTDSALGSASSADQGDGAMSDTANGPAS